MNRDDVLSKPREVIARALHRADVEPRRFDPHWNVHEWDGLSDPAKVYWYRLADALMPLIERAVREAASEAAASAEFCGLMPSEIDAIVAGVLRAE